MKLKYNCWLLLPKYSFKIIRVYGVSSRCQLFQEMKRKSQEAQHEYLSVSGGVTSLFVSLILRRRRDKRMAVNDRSISVRCEEEAKKKKLQETRIPDWQAKQVNLLSREWTDQTSKEANSRKFSEDDEENVWEMIAVDAVVWVGERIKLFDEVSCRSLSKLDEWEKKRRKPLYPSHTTSKINWFSQEDKKKRGREEELKEVVNQVRRKTRSGPARIFFFFGFVSRTTCLLLLST